MASLTPNAVGIVGIVGLGLIGGSLARALLARGVTVRGWSRSADDGAGAAEAGVHLLDLASVGERPNSALRDLAIVVLAVPLDAIAASAEILLDHVSPECVVLHVGGIQSRRALVMSDRTHARVFGAHPMAGSHGTGFASSRPDLFARAPISIEARMPASARGVVEALWRDVGVGRLVYRDAAEHDALMAWVSHLPQVVATALAATLGDEGISALDAGPGARDTTRLAACSADAWRPLLTADRAQLLLAIAQLERTLARMRTALDGGTDEALLEVAAVARGWRAGADVAP